MKVETEFIAAGGNRYPSAADWAPGVLAFGSDNNVALWNPDEPNNAGVYSLLAGHDGAVTVVKLYTQGGKQRIISGSADKTLRVWEAQTQSLLDFGEVQCLKAHSGSINTIAISEDIEVIVSGSADGTLRVWSFDVGSVKPIQSITLKPRYLPLAAAITALPSGDAVVAVAGTASRIQLFVKTRTNHLFELQATLEGHEGWIRSLDFTPEHQRADSDVLLASASQDKYTRLWRFSRHAEQARVEETAVVDLASAIEKGSLSNKTHRVGSQDTQYSVTFEALLIGHEDWIYTAKWAPASRKGQPPALLSASADNSLSIWHADSASGLWVCSARLGEVSSQKGSTTATGSTGGFWVGLWHPNAVSVACLGRTGSWRKWSLDSQHDVWNPQIGISGHTQEVRGLAWAPDGSYLLSTGADQTTRLLCEWRRDGKKSWHEFSRPQIHGYDLNCIGTVNEDRLISGADEKLLRVFNKPKAVDSLLSKLCGISSSSQSHLPDAANIPVLGLSNKAVTTADDQEDNDAMGVESNDRESIDPGSVTYKNTLDLLHPPLEDHLARHTLWPEHEKLYGHGYEISTVATNQDGSLVATACKASSIDHATIRLYETRHWREIKPPLIAHNLTVTALAFSPDDRYLLSVGRDRQWAIFRQDEESRQTYRLHTTDPKGHSRMILDCTWAPASIGHVFATAGRDKSVKIWRLREDSAGPVERITTLSAHASVTAVAFDVSRALKHVHLAFATEDGHIRIFFLDGESLVVLDEYEVDGGLSPSKTVNAIRWRPSTEESGILQFATVSDDQSVRIYRVC